MTISQAAANALEVASRHSQFSNILSIGRGGAITAVASQVISSAILKNVEHNHTGESIEDQQKSFVTSINRGGKKSPETTTTSPSGGITPQGKSVLYMAIAMSLHYLSYSIARPSTIALFTSAKTGFAGNKAAFPLAMAFISPASLSLLFLYSKILGKVGPKGAIRQTTFIVASVLWVSSAFIYFLSRGVFGSLSISLFGIAKIPVLQFLVGALFIFRESYVQLLTSQYWSFMASTLNPVQSAKWFSPISGLTSITSAIAGLGVTQVVEKVGLPGALGEYALLILLNYIFFQLNNSLF
jgi:hypothetical protein